MNAVLVMFKTDGARREFPITKERMILGRMNTCDLRIPLPSVSRQHCELRLSDDLRIRDLGSSNGTYHNGSRVEEAVLQAGDEVVVGPVVFTVVVDGEPSDIEPVHTVLHKQGSGQVSSPTGETASEGQALQGQALGNDDSSMPTDIEPEGQSPTIDLDDPIAALQSMGDEDDDDGVTLLDDDED